MDFHNLDEYYEYVESDTTFKHLDFNTSKYITALRDKTDNEDLKKIYSYELFFSDFSIENGVHIPKFQIGEKSYPALELFDDNFEYIKSRAKNIQNSKYKAKYNHLLWLSPQKKIDFAKQAIENYLLLLQNSSFTVDDNSQNYSFATYFKNLFVLCQTVNYKKDEVIQYSVSLLENDKLNDVTKHSLMSFIIENGKKIDSSITQTFFDYSNKSIKNLESRVLEYYLNLLVILSQKLQISTCEFYEKLGDYHISQLKTEENQGFIAYHYYTNALEEYKKANNKEKIEKTAVLLEQSKKTIDLKKVPFEFRDEKINNALNKLWKHLRSNISDLIENNDSNMIYNYLIVANIFPKAETLKEEIRPVTFDLVSTTLLDINKNVKKSKSSSLNPYFIHIDNFSIHHIWLVVSKGIKSGKISFESLIDYLKNNSWYGQDFTYVDKNNEIQGFNWIELLSPSLQSFFIQAEIDIKTNKHNALGYIIAIDSFVLKFEGLLREFSKKIGAQTIEIKETGTEERINFDKLLDNDKLTDLIPEDDIAYFKFLFTSEGLNLRNNIAHCFFTTKNYNSATMLLLIVALLRLGDYKLLSTEK
ncbi:DUF4209 domain-containing protein [Flavobacterium sp. GSP14]|uniref:DUF4209 domain-containing protein n=1 Tax=Flavobacterium sp. GSP14 TaxID=3401734 RepID=UPI003AAAF62A